MQTLPSDVKSIVYRCIYDDVLDELCKLYGTTLRLHRITHAQRCDRIRQDRCMSIGWVCNLKNVGCFALLPMWDASIKYRDRDGYRLNAS
jgi:hypothetical protein